MAGMDRRLEEIANCIRSLNFVARELKELNRLQEQALEQKRWKRYDKGSKEH